MNVHDRALEVFKAMCEQSNDGIWEGRLTELVAGMGYTSYYGRIVGILKASDACEQLQRGGMGVPSRWRILKPESDLSPEAGPKGGIIRKRDKLEARIEAVENRMGGLDIALAISDIIRRQDILERLVLNVQTNGDRPETGSAATQSLQVDGGTDSGEA